MSSPVRDHIRAPPGPAVSCTRMPSHFHSARHSAGFSSAKSRSSSGCASISGRNTGAPFGSGRGPFPSSQRNSGR
jgi:hypothetical protein